MTAPGARCCVLLGMAVSAVDGERLAQAPTEPRSGSLCLKSAVDGPADP